MWRWPLPSSSPAGWPSGCDRVVIVRLGVALQALFYLSVLILGRESRRAMSTLLGSFYGDRGGIFLVGL